jgi:putative transposase
VAFSSRTRPSGAGPANSDWITSPPQAQEAEPLRHLASRWVVITIAGQKHWLWRAVDQDGYVLDEVVQARRDTKAAKRLLRRLLKKQGCPTRRLITDRLGLYPAAQRQIIHAVEHRSHEGLNNRAGNSHLPLCRRERVMQGFRSSGGLQRATAVFSAVRNLFVPTRSRRSALATHLHRLNAMVEWKTVAGIAA